MAGNTPITNKLQERLEDLVSNHKEKTGLSHNQIANGIGIAPSALSAYLNSQKEAGINSLSKIANYFAVSTDFLLGGHDCVTPQNEEIRKRLGLSDEAIETLQKYQMYQIHNEKTVAYINASGNAESPEFKKLSKELKLMREKIDVALITEYPQKLEAINTLLKNEKDFSIIKNIASYLMCDFARYPKEEYPREVRGNEEYKKVLDNNFSVYDRTTDGAHRMPYSILNAAYLVEAQTQLSRLRDKMVSEKKETT